MLPKQSWIWHNSSKIIAFFFSTNKHWIKTQIFEIFWGNISKLRDLWLRSSRSMKQNNHSSIFHLGRVLHFSRQQLRILKMINLLLSSKGHTKPFVGRFKTLNSSTVLLTFFSSFVHHVASCFSTISTWNEQTKS